MLLAPTPIFLVSLLSVEAPALTQPLPQPLPLPSVATIPAPLVDSPSLASVLSAAQAPERRDGFEWGPRFTLAVGVHAVTGYYDTYSGDDPDEDLAWSLDACIYNWDGEKGLGLEFGLMQSSYTASAGVLSSDESVDTYRVSAGVRFADRGSDNPIYIPFVRAGGMYRKDDGNVSSDDGFGWYIGGGIDFRIGTRFAITPSVLFTDTSSMSAQDWVYGVLATFGF
jgi:hypothetical protein